MLSASFVSSQILKDQAIGLRGPRNGQLAVHCLAILIVTTNLLEALDCKAELLDRLQLQSWPPLGACFRSFSLYSSLGFAAKGNEIGRWWHSPVMNI